MAAPIESDESGRVVFVGPCKPRCLIFSNGYSQIEKTKSAQRAGIALDAIKGATISKKLPPSNQHR
jgi:hypothetical protein